VRRPRLAGPILALAGILYTVPALAMFVFMLPLTGLSIISPIVALTIYTLIILVRNVIDGINSVPADVRDAAEAMGYKRGTRMLRVELPLALPVIVAGVRIATISTIGLVAISVIVSWGGLGTLMFSLGFQRNFFLTPILLGLALSIVLAVIADLSLVAVERALTPWARGR
jgi:osmoprotectant transport system permease protein